MRTAISREVENEIIPGVSLHAFVKNGHRYYLASIEIYKDGVIYAADFTPLDFDGLKDKVRTGMVTVALPEGARVSMMTGDLHFTVSDVKSQVEEVEFIKEIEDEIRRLNGQPISLELFEEALSRCHKSPTNENKDKLRQAHEAVPKHWRKSLNTFEYRRLLGIA